MKLESDSNRKDEDASKEETLRKNFIKTFGKFYNIENAKDKMLKASSYLERDRKLFPLPKRKIAQHHKTQDEMMRT